MRLQAHVRDGVDAVVAFDDGGGFLEQPLELFFLEVLVVALGLVLELHLAAALGGALGGFGGGQVFFVDEHVEQFVVGLDGRQTFGHGAFGFAGHAGDQVALPDDFVAGLLSSAAPRPRLAPSRRRWCRCDLTLQCA